MKSFILENEILRAEFIEYGARLKSLVYKPAGTDVCVGCDSGVDYLLDSSNFGATVGRYCNRIANAAFDLDGVHYTLPANDGSNCLHGGRGFAYRNFTGEKADKSDLVLVYTSPDGEEGFPGELKVSAHFYLDGGALVAEYRARTDKPTVCCITNHAYFNLDGEGNIGSHVLKVNADEFLAIDSSLIPTERTDVTGTPFDFRTSHAVSDKIDDDDEQLRLAGGYDHTFIIRGEGMREAAVLSSRATGIRMTLETNMPGVQVYSGNFMGKEQPLLRGGKRQQRRHGICLEPQLFPNSPNRPDFPSSVLRPGEEFISCTKYIFDR